MRMFPGLFALHAKIGEIGSIEQWAAEARQNLDRAKTEEAELAPLVAEYRRAAELLPAATQELEKTRAAIEKLKTERAALQAGVEEAAPISATHPKKQAVLPPAAGAHSALRRPGPRRSPLPARA